ncbi:MAG TPA: dienelactone hydrolase family protein [Candidatus Cybelea sp.]|nr:dienelactone hydrolase family protein [Candidatus Cybelea sp.]
MPLIADGKPDPRDAAVIGYLFKPAGEGPFPAVILMHGCDGLGWETLGKASWFLHKSYAHRYVEHGYVALVLDSFRPRGVEAVCGKPFIVSPQRRVWDAYSAARVLGNQGFVDKSRIVLQGLSHGGWTVLMAMQQPAGVDLPEHFAAAIAWYPYCYPVRFFSAPLLILIGGSDDWTPSRRCEDMVRGLRRESGDPDVVLDVYGDALHAYDYPYRARTNAIGHRMAYDAKATDASWRAIDDFLARYVPARR